MGTSARPWHVHVKPASPARSCLNANSDLHKPFSECREQEPRSVHLSENFAPFSQTGRERNSGSARSLFSARIADAWPRVGSENPF